METDALIPALYQADSPQHAAGLLMGLTREELKPLAKEFGGFLRINDDVTEDMLREKILAGLSEKKALTPVATRLGDVVTIHTEEGGEEQVTVTPELVAAAQHALHRLAQAEYSVQRGLVEICVAIRDFRDARGYVAAGYPSFAAWCNAGQLRVFGQVRSRRWAYDRIQDVEALGEEVVQHVAQLPQRDLRKLVRLAASSGMEHALEQLQADGQITYEAADGTTRTLRPPEGPDDVAAWREFIAEMGRKTAEAAAEVDEARTDLARAKEEAAQEAEALRREIEQKEGEIRDLQGLSEDAISKLLKKPVGALTDDDAVRLQHAVANIQNDLRQLRADLSAKDSRVSGLTEEIERHAKAAAEVGNTANTRALLDSARDQIGKALDSLGPLRANADDLPPRSRQLAFDTLSAIENEVRELADCFNTLG